MRVGPLGSAALLAGALGSVTSVAPAQVRSLRWDPGVDGTVTGAGAAAWIASQALAPMLAPAGCRWCTPDGPDAALRDGLVWRDPATANTLSNVSAFLLVPIAAIGLDAIAAAHDGQPGDLGVDALLVAESTVVAADLDQATKFLVGRERPFVHALPPDQKAEVPRPADSNLSFFSGHTTEAFAMATSAGTVASLRQYRWAPTVWAVGLPLAAVTGYLRMAADKHWFTDVLVGVLVGAGVGVGIPCLFHGAESAQTAQATPGAPIRAASFALAW